MTEEERIRFVEQQTQRILTMLGDRSVSLNEDAVRYVKQFVDSYVTRTDSLSQEPFQEGLHTIYGRGSQFAPMVTRHFEQRGVPPVMGLYVAMAETEYHTCPETPHHAKGMFLFIPETARAYGVDPAERCDVEKIVPAAAHYMADRIAEFGSDGSSMTLALLSFDRNPDIVRRDMRYLRV
jgi:hypothetical protein